MAFFRSIPKNPFPPFHYFPKPNSFSSSSPLSGDPLVSATVSILKHHRSKSRWSHLRSLLTAANDSRLTPSQFSEIALQIRNNPHLALGFFHFTLRHSLSSHSLSSYATVVHILSRSRLKSHALDVIKSAMRVFSEAQQANPVAILEALIKTYRVCDSAPFVFDLLVKACIESKKIDLAVQICSMLKSKSVFLGTNTCNSLIELVSKSRGCFAGYDLYREIFYLDVDNVARNGRSDKGISPNANTLNVLMIGFYREGLLDKVREVWEEFVKLSIVPNTYSFNTLMSAYCDEERMEEAMEIWEEMEKHSLSCDAVSYNTIIGGFTRVGLISRAEGIYREMVTNGVESTCLTFEHLIKGYCKIGDLDSALMLYKDMCRRSFCPDSSTVNGIIRSFCDKNKVFTALEFWRNAIEKKHEAVLEKENYERLIQGLCREGKMEYALDLQAEMVVRGFEPDSKIYDAFIEGYKKQGNEMMAGKLREEMLCKKNS